MPWSIDEGKDKVKKLLNETITEPSMRILDLGCGMGTYGRLIEKPCYKVGVDAVDYFREYALMMYYNKFYRHDIRDIAWLRTLGTFDVAICGDILEHLSIKDAKAVLGALEAFSDRILVAVPFEWEQSGWKNKWEDHQQPDLTPEIVKERYPELKPLAIYINNEQPWNGKPFYGYYIWQKEGEWNV